MSRNTKIAAFVKNGASVVAARTAERDTEGRKLVRDSYRFGEPAGRWIVVEVDETWRRAAQCMRAGMW